MYERCNYYASISISIILGIIIGILFYFGRISNIQSVFIVVSIISFINYIIFTIYSLINSNNINNVTITNERNNCKCRYLRVIFISIIGTILLSILGLGIGDLTINLTLGAILVGLISVFLFSQIINIYFYISCMMGTCPREINYREYNDCNNYRNYYYDNRNDNF